MRIVQTLYSGDKADFLAQTFGWFAPEYHVMGWALSCLQLKKYYSDLTLYADGRSADLLINKLKLPYTNVQITHEELRVPSAQLWALSKIYTYSLQQDPFLHVDGDVFIFKCLPDRLMGASLIAQNVEVATEYYRSMQEELSSKAKYIPEFVQRDFESKNPIKAVNAGILGGSDIRFINDFCRIAFEYVDKNSSILPSIRLDLFNVFVEQQLFYSLSKEKRAHVECLFSEIIPDNRYELFNEFQETPCIRTYLHLIGQFKRDQYSCSQMAEKLRCLHPTYYFTIKEFFRKNAKSHFLSFRDPYPAQVTDSEKIEKYGERALKKYARSSKDTNVNKRFYGKGTNDVQPRLFFLQTLAKQIKSLDRDLREQKEIEADFKRFSRKLANYLKFRYTNLYLYGRDIDSATWLCQLFGKDQEIENKEIICCKEIIVIKSNYDWVGLFDQPLKMNMPHFRDLSANLQSGRYFNLIVSETSSRAISAFDIDEIDTLILSCLKTAKSIRRLVSDMEVYFENDVILGNKTLYRAMIINASRELVKKKAIKPA